MKIQYAKPLHYMGVGWLLLEGRYEVCLYEGHLWAGACVSGRKERRRPGGNFLIAAPATSARQLPVVAVSAGKGAGSIRDAAGFRWDGRHGE